MFRKLLWSRVHPEGKSELFCFSDSSEGSVLRSESGGCFVVENNDSGFQHTHNAHKHNELPHKHRERLYFFRPRRSFSLETKDATILSIAKVRRSWNRLPRVSSWLSSSAVSTRKPLFITQNYLSTQFQNYVCTGRGMMKRGEISEWYWR